MTKFSKTGIRATSLLLCVACLFALAMPMSVSAGETPAPQALSSIVRKSASFTGYNIGRMEDGTMLTVLGEKGSFYKIDCYDMTGYIAKEQVLHTEDGKYYVNCQADSSETVAMTYTEHSAALQLRHAVIQQAKNKLGCPYVYGATGPRAFDCSGLMQYIFEKNGITLHRGSSGQLQDGIIVAKEGLQTGDLVFFKTPGEVYPTSHVGIYVGNGMIIHAGNGSVRYDKLDTGWCARYYLCARRIINSAAAEICLDIPGTVDPGVSLPVRTASGRGA